MTFNRTLLLSGIIHSLLGYMLLNHTPDRIAPAMTTPELAHFIQVRLQLTPGHSERLPMPKLVEETAAAPAEKVEETNVSSPPTKVQRVAKRVEKSPKVKVAKKSKGLKRKPLPQTERKAAPSLVVETSSSQTDDSPSSDVQASISGQITPDSIQQQASQRIAPLSKKQRRSLKQSYWSNLTRFFKASGYQYPKRAILAGQEGKVYIVIEIDPSGLIVDAKIGKSSGFPLLDDSALKAVLATKRVPPLPERLKRRNHKFRIPIEYRLPS